MTSYQKLAAVCIATMVLFAHRIAACAQPPETTVPPDAAAKPNPPQPRPAAGAPASPPAGKSGKAADTTAEPVQPLLETNPAVRAALELPRKDPKDFVQAILWLIDLGRPELAKPILAELTKLQITDPQRIALVAEFGSQGMLHLARAKDLAPDGATFADACMAAAAAAANNPQRIATLVKQLVDPSPEIRTIARHDLAATGQLGVTAALEALAQETDLGKRAAFISAAELMHPLVDRPLLAMLETNDPNLRADVAMLLRQLAVPQAVPLAATDAASAERALATAIANYKRGTPPFAADESNQVELWKWDDATKKLSAARVPVDEVQTIWIARLASELARIRPNSFADQRQALVLRLESAGLASGPGKAAGQSPPTFPSLPKADPQLLNAALADALKSNYSHAALALVDALGQRGDVNNLLTADAKPSPLASALASPNPRVRFAALKAMMALNPAAPYPGSSRVPEALTWFAGCTGERRAVVAMPTNAAAGDLAGQLAADKLSAEPTNRGRDAVDIARTTPDLEAIFIDMNIIVPGIRQALYELRISPTTGDVPIALLAADGRLEAAQRLAAEHTRVIAVPRPHTADVVARTVEDLAKLSARDAVPPAERAAQAEQAKKWIAQLSSGNRPFYTFRRTAMLTPPPSRLPSQVPEALPAP